MLVQQRPVMSRRELRTQLELLLVRDIRPGQDGEPNTAMLRKASTLVDQLMALIDRYAEGSV